MKMKYILQFTSLLLATVIVLMACDKTDDLPIYETGTGSNLTLSTSNVTLTDANKGSDVVKFSWTDPQFATDPSNYKYVVEIAPKGTNFANPYVLTTVGGATGDASITGAQLNSAMIAWGLPYAQSADLDVRLKSSYANNNDLKVSPVVNLKVTPYAVPFTLTASSTGPFSPTPQTKDNILTKLSWGAPNYGTSTVSYVLEYSKAGTNFASTKTITIAADSLQKSLTGMELYQMANGVIIPLGTNGSVDVRIKATVNGTGQVSYSNIQTLTIKPVEMILYMYMPGDYQGWSPASAAKLASSDGINYEGYVWVPAGGSGEFKMTSDPDWNHTNYGGTSTATGGTLDASGGNLKWPATGKYYLVKVNMDTKEWTVTETSWGLIGSATPGGWDNSTPMSYDPAIGKWKATVTFTAAEFKFRANNSWDINLGADPANVPYLWYGKDNIPITAGSKTVLLDLSNPLKYTYTVQ